MTQPNNLTAVPATIQALIGIFGAAAPLDPNNRPIMVWYGRELGVFSEPTTIEINGVSQTQSPAELGPTYRREEEFYVHCKVSVFSGEGADSQDHVNRMIEAWNVWKALEVAVANNPTLNGNVRYAEMVSVDDLPSTSPRGSAMHQLSFELRCEQRVTSLS
jgi:hypothetical protein